MNVKGKKKSGLFKTTILANKFGTLGTPCSSNQCWDLPTYMAQSAHCVHRNTTLKGGGGREGR